MSDIKLLDESIINKIAAGEVVENPKSIVKEMVENSLDAGATKITIEIKDGGKELIRISDNGKGINRNDVETAFVRHATSKISKESDLNNIFTLGFRGEALSSISEVSKVILVTKTESDLTGTSVVIEGGKMLKKEDVGCNVGTTFTISELFYNVPARKKFLKKTSTESSYIYDLVNALALSTPKVSFKLINNGTVVLQTSGNGNLKHVLFQIYGKKIIDNIHEIQYKNDLISIHGYIADPIKNNRAIKKYGTFILNGRCIKSDLMYDAVKEALGDNLMNGKYPIFCLNIKIDPVDVDVNVHPNKLEVRFSDEKLIFDTVYVAVKNIFSDNSILKKENKKAFVEIAETKPYVVEEIKTLDNVEKINNTTNVKYENKYTPSGIVAKENKKDSVQKNIKSIINEIYENKEKNTESLHKIKEADKFLDEEYKKAVEETKSMKEEVQFKFIGQLFNTYCIIEKESNIYLIDQHAAHEKVSYEKILNQLKNDAVQTQILLQPLSVVLTDSETEYLLNNLSLFKKFGFEIQEFGKNTFALRGMPILFSQPVGVDFFNDTLDLLINENKKIDSIYDLKLNKIATIACKSSVKANTYLSEKEVRDLISNMLMLENPNTCPHGRPTMIEISKKEIEKMFKRIL